MEVILSSETTVHVRTTQLYIPKYSNINVIQSRAISVSVRSPNLIPFFVFQLFMGCYKWLKSVAVLGNTADVMH
jgi:hypothetical protein